MRKDFESPIYRKSRLATRLILKARSGRPLSPRQRQLAASLAQDAAVTPRLIQQGINQLVGRESPVPHSTRKPRLSGSLPFQAHFPLTNRQVPPNQHGIKRARLTLFSADKTDRFFRVIKFWMDETSGIALALKTGVPSDQVEDEEGGRLCAFSLKKPAHQF